MAKRRTIRVRVDLTITIDLDDYRANYGTDDIPTIRRDVRAAVRDAAATGGVLADGIIDATLADDRRL